MGDPFYNTPYWRHIREIILERDDYRCAVQGCNETASVVDHIKSRRSGGDESLNNLRSLCRLHDNQMRESLTGRRKSHGRAPTICDANGMPTSPTHPWFRRSK